MVVTGRAAADARQSCVWQDAGEAKRAGKGRGEQQLWWTVVAGISTIA